MIASDSVIDHRLISSMNDAYGYFVVGRSIVSHNAHSENSTPSFSHGDLSSHHAFLRHTKIQSFGQFKLHLMAEIGFHLALGQVQLELMNGRCTRCLYGEIPVLPAPR